MIKPAKILLILFFAFSVKAHSQKVLVGFQLGPNSGYPKGNIEGVWGINLAFVNKNGIILEIGRYKSAIGYGGTTLNGNTIFLGNTINSAQIPVRLQKRINILKNKIFINPSAGLSYLYHVDSHVSYGHAYTAYPGDTTFYSFSNQSLHKNGFLAEAGAKVEFIILKYLSLNFACYYSRGFYSLAQTTYTYNEPSVNKSGEEKITSKGNNLQFFAGLSYTIYDKQRWDTKIHKKTREFHNQVLLGLKLGVKNSGYPEAYHNAFLFPGGAFGINMTFVNKKGILLETGINESDMNYGKSTQLGGGSYVFGRYLVIQQIPLRLQKRISIIENIFFTPSAGMAFLHAPKPQSSTINGTSIDRLNGDTIYTSNNSQLIHKNGFSPEIGAKVEFIFFNNLVLNLASYYSYGLRPLAETTYSYNEPSQNISGTGKVTSRGNSLQFSVGLSYCIYDKQRRLERVNNKKAL
jgi:hypothetical protein